MSQFVCETTDANFEADVLKSEKPVLVDFWAEWCHPCKMIMPIIEEAADQFQGQLKVVKLNIDQNPETPVKYAVRGIPTLLLFKGGDLLATKVGALSKSELKQFLDEVVE